MPPEGGSMIPPSKSHVDYGFKGALKPNRLPDTRIVDMKGTHFEIGNQALKEKL